MARALPYRCFNSRAREGRDCGKCRACRINKAFQFTRPRGARPRVRWNLPFVPRSFNSRAREGRDGEAVARLASEVEFQFTRPRGARLVSASMLPIDDLFQFTRPRGARQCPGVRYFESADVSIHAPARGATQVLSGRRAGNSCFNSRAREGRDTRNEPAVAPESEFQFTRPRGARLMSAAYLARYSKFQFTRPRGARHLREIHKILKEVSIHAPARGATSSGPRRQARELVSIHAPARGATPSPRPSLPNSWFQFTRPRGARLERNAGRCGFRSVSIHAPARGATG